MRARAKRMRAVVVLLEVQVPPKWREEEQEEEEGAEEDSVLASRLRSDALGGIGPAEQHEA